MNTLTSGSTLSYDGPFGKQQMRIFNYGDRDLIEIIRDKGEMEQIEEIEFDNGFTRCFIRGGKVVTQLQLSRQATENLASLIQYNHHDPKRIPNKTKRNGRSAEEGGANEELQVQSEITNLLLRDQKS